MARRLPIYLYVVLALALLFDLAVWGAAPQLDDAGTGIVASANREAPLAATYVGLGRHLDALVPPLGTFGRAYLQDALAEGLPQIAESPTAAMDLIFSTSWNRAHRWLKIAYWLPPILLAVALALWWMRSRKVRLIGPQ
jgi:hypothetical protein